VFPVPPEEDEAATLSAPLVERRLQRFLPRAEAYPVKYTGLYRVHQRVARVFRVGRVLLAGDAAHLNNPLGAFGLNGGIHDAVNLAEKLGRVCRGEADPALLDRYDRQRRTVNLEYVQEASIRNLQGLAAREPGERRRYFDELRQVASTPDGTRRFLLGSSMIASVRRADTIA
jgi:3-(3-hydroxy-phenyl)propionate hydroxylase